MTLFISGIFGSVPGAFAQTTDIPGLEVTAALPGTVHQAETFAVTFELTNTGPATLETVVVTAQGACGPSSADGLVGFTEVQGNGDALLDPTEVWSYLAPRCIDSGAPSAAIDVSAFDGIDTLSGVYTFGYTPVAPLEVTSLGDVSSDECLVRKFDIPLRVITGTPSQDTRAFLAYAIPLEGGGLQVVDRVEFAEIQQISGNGDAIFDSGEDWLAGFFFGTLTECPDVPEPPLVLLLSMDGTSVDSGATWCFGTEGCPTPAMQVGTIIELATEQEDPPTARDPPGVTDPTLPFTGPKTDGLALLGVTSIAVGTLILASSRRRSDP